MAAFFPSTVRCLLLVWFALVGSAAADLKARRLAVSFASGATNTITIEADYIVGTLIVTGSSTDDLDIATLSDPWMNTLAELTGGLAVIVSITTNVLTDTGSEKTHQMTIVYRILPVDGTALDLSVLLSDSSTLDSVIWDVFADNCGSVCSDFNLGDSDGDTNWDVSSESDAETQTGEVEYPATFDITAAATTTTLATTTTRASSATTAAGSGSGSSATTAASGTGDSSYKVTTTTTVGSTCGSPTVTGFDLSTDYVATFTWCEEISFRAGQYVYFQLYDSEGTDVEGEETIALLSSHFVSTTSFQVDVSSHISAGIFFRLALESGTVADSSATLSTAYTSALFAVASDWTPSSSSAEEEGLSTALIAVIVGTAALVVLLFVCCVCLCRLLSTVPTASNDDDNKNAGWNFFYMNTPSMNLGKMSRVHPTGVGIVVQGVPDSSPTNMLNLEDPPKPPTINEGGMSPSISVNSINSMSQVPSATTSRPIVSSRSPSKLSSRPERSPRPGRDSSKLSGVSPRLDPRSGGSPAFSPGVSPGVSPRLEQGRLSPNTDSSWSSPRSVAT